MTENERALLGATAGQALTQATRTAQLEARVSQADATANGAAGLALVLGVFVLGGWLLRRSGLRVTRARARSVAPVVPVRAVGEAS